MGEEMTTKALNVQERLELILRRLYPTDAAELAADLMSHPLPSQQTLTDRQPAEPTHHWDAATAVLITYPDGVEDSDLVSLKALSCCLDSALGQLFSVVHVLPFLQASGDGGFAISNHNQLEPRFGDWGDLARLATGRRLMADLVLNHVSASHDWVKAFRQGTEDGAPMVLEPLSQQGWQAVVRPRSTPLFTPFTTTSGERLLWTTFGPDQVDLNWRNPAVLRAFVAQMDRLLSLGVTWFRLDAVGFVWKTPQTTCIHLPQVHDLIRALRLLLRQRSQEGTLVSETNVPQPENLSYILGGDEAHLAYNFPLPPLLLEAMVSGRADLLRQWLETWPALPPSCTLLNFAASHDGVGLRPLEGLMSASRRQALVASCNQRGGCISTRQVEGVDRPYEINIAWWSAMGAPEGREDPQQLPRHLCSLLLLLALPGVPAFYLPALLAAGNDRDRFGRTGQARDLHRPRFSLRWVQEQLARSDSGPAQIVSTLQRGLALRQRLPGLDPAAAMVCPDPDNPALLLVQRGQGPETIWALHNLAATPQPLPTTILKSMKQTGDGGLWWDWMRDCSLPMDPAFLIDPYQVLWLQRLP